MRYRPHSIEDQGLKGYLNATRSRHNGKGYDDFLFLIDIARKDKLAEVFNVDQSTLYRWVKLHEKERSHARSKN